MGVGINSQERDPKNVESDEAKSCASSSGLGDIEGRGLET